MAKVHPYNGHRNSDVTLIIIADSFEENIAKKIKNDLELNNDNSIGTSNINEIINNDEIIMRRNSLKDDEERNKIQRKLSKKEKKNNNENNNIDIELDEKNISLINIDTKDS